MEERDIASGNELAKRAGVANSHIARIRNCESAATVDLVDKIAAALGVQPWELLADDESARRAAMEKMLWGPRVTDARAAEHLPPAPAHTPPKPKRKRRRRSEGGNDAR